MRFWIPLGFLLIQLALFGLIVVRRSWPWVKRNFQLSTGNYVRKGHLFPLYVLEFSNYYLTREDAFSLVLDQEAQKLKEGANAFLTVSAGGEFWRNLGYFLQLRAKATETKGNAELYRGYVYFKAGKLFFVLGKDNVKIGPARYGGFFPALLLLSGR